MADSKKAARAAKQFTIEAIVSARHPHCTYSAEQLTELVAKRFPKGGEVPLTALVDSWLDDASLDGTTLRQCAYLACQLGNLPAIVRGESMRLADPRKALAFVREKL